MTVSTTYTPATYTGDGSTTEFTLGHLVYESSHVTVTVDGTTVNTYSVAGLGDASGITVTFDTAPANGTEVIIQRIVPYTQDTDLENFDGNPADVTEKQFDLLSMMSQQLSEINSRAIKIPVGEGTTTTLTDAADRANDILGFDASGNVAAKALSTIGAAVFPLSSTDNAFVKFDGTGGSSVQNSSTTEDDNGNLTANVLATGTDTARSLADRHGDAINVKDFGAVGDWNYTTSTGTDDTAAIQAAIDYCEANQRDLYVPNGNYRITSKLTAQLMGFTMFGDGIGISRFGSGGNKPSPEHTYKTAFVWDGANSTPMLELGDASLPVYFNNHIMDIGFNGRQVSGVIGIRGYWLNNVRFTRVSTTGCGYGIRLLEPCNNPKFFECMIHDSATVGIDLTEKCHGAAFFGTQIWGGFNTDDQTSSGAAATAGLRIGEVDGCNQVTLVGCQIECINTTNQLQAIRGQALQISGGYFEISALGTGNEDNIIEIGNEGVADDIWRGVNIDGAKFAGNNVGNSAINLRQCTNFNLGDGCHFGGLQNWYIEQNKTYCENIQIGNSYFANVDQITNVAHENIISDYEDNLLWMGGVQVWQRGSGTFSSAGYTADGVYWTPGDGAGTVDRAIRADWATPVYEWAQTSNATSTAPSIRMRIEGADTLNNNMCTLQFDAKDASVTPILKLRVRQNFGTGGSPSSEIELGVSEGLINQTLTTSMATYAATFRLPSTSGKTFGTNEDSYLEVEIIGPTGQTFDIDIGRISLHAGSNVQPFRKKPEGEVKVIAERYCKNIGIGIPVVVFDSTRIMVSSAFQPEMYSAPTATLLTTTPGVNLNGSTSTTLGSSSTLSTSSLQANGFRTRIDGFTGLTAGDVGVVITTDIIRLEAEI